MAEDRDLDHADANKTPTTLNMNFENGVEEPNFSDPEDFVDDVSDEGILQYCLL